MAVEITMPRARSGLLLIHQAVRDPALAAQIRVYRQRRRMTQEPVDQVLKRRRPFSQSNELQKRFDRRLIKELG